jgi:ribosome-associated protein
MESEATSIVIQKDSAGDQPMWIEVPLSEISITFVRSSGPGGQHVNKTSTQAELTFDLGHSPSIPESDRQWLVARLATKLDSHGVLRITSQEYRSQLRNKRVALEKLEQLLQTAIHRPKKRKKTRPTRSAVEKRLSSKKKDSEKKKMRSHRGDD